MKESSGTDEVSTHTNSILLPTTPDSRFNKLVHQAHFVCYIEYFAILNMEEKHFDEIFVYFLNTNTSYT